MNLPFFWIDAFTTRKLGGNPCAVVLNADALTPPQMQALAREMNLSETAFVRSSFKANFAARYFTPQEELPFAGHPTLSAVSALIDAGAINLKRETTVLTLEVPAGIIPIEVSNRKIIMSQLAPKFLRSYDPREIARIFGITPDDLLPGFPIQTVSTGTPILMIPIKDHEALKRVRYADPEAYFRLKASADFSFPHHFCLQGATAEGQTFARSLGTPPNGLEDPFTGSATGCMAAYLWHHGLIPTPSFVAEQGHWLGRPGKAEVDVVGTPQSIETIRVKGEAVTLIRGQINVEHL